MKEHKSWKKTLTGLVIIVVALAVFVIVFALNQQNAKDNDVQENNSNQSQQNEVNVQEEALSEVNRQQGKITISVGSERFSATLADNATEKAFSEQLPLTLNMSDVNGNEKAYDLPDALPTNASNPGRIQNGDIMLYGSRTIVLFYDSFDTSYAYTRIGQVDNPAQLYGALGSGNAAVTFNRE